MGDILESLVAAGITAAPAARIEKAVSDAVSKGLQSVFSAPQSAGRFPVFDSKSPFALQASAPQSTYNPNGTFGPGPAALRVSGLAAVTGQLVVSDDAYVNGTARVASVIANGPLLAGDASVSSVLIPGMAELARGRAGISAPLTASGGLSSFGHALFVGQNEFRGDVSIGGKVDWKGPRDPQPSRVVTLLSENDDETIRLDASNVAVLNDYGPAAAETLAAFCRTTTGALAATVSLTASTLAISAAATFHAVTQVITYVTAATFDPETCSVSTATATAAVVTGGTVSVSPTALASAITARATVTAAGTTNGVVVFTGKTDDPVVSLKITVV